MKTGPSVEYRLKYPFLKDLAASNSEEIDPFPSPAAARAGFLENINDCQRSERATAVIKQLMQL
jgi:hypothetical protein